MYLRGNNVLIYPLSDFWNTVCFVASSAVLSQILRIRHTECDLCYAEQLIMHLELGRTISVIPIQRGSNVDKAVGKHSH